MKNMPSQGNSRIISLIANVRSGLMFLKFPGNSEKAFRRYYYKKSISQIRFAFFVAIFLFAIVGFIDPYVVPDVHMEVWSIRFIVVVPTLLLSFLAALSFRKELVMQLTGSLSVLVAGSAIGVMMFIDPGLGSQIYYGGLILTIIYGYSFIRLRFAYATVSGWAVTLFYILTAALIRKTPFPILINNSFFISVTNIIGMFISYVLEVNLRSEYLHAIAMKRTHRQLQKLSIFDDLTKIPNRRLFDTRLSLEFEALKHTSQPLSLIIIDVDFFKDYNDYFGHIAGDRCLMRIAEKLQQFAARAGDLAARYGGEEFAIILSNTSRAEARLMAERIRQEVRKMRILHPRSPIDNIVTLSLGVAAIIPSRHNSFMDLISAADDALYRAKEKGRDKVEVSSIE